MELNKDLFINIAKRLQVGEGGRLGPCSPDTLAWCVMQRVPQWLLEFFKTTIPKSELWAGAGVLFDERRMVALNRAFPEACANSLLIIGSAPNGDHTALDLATGGVGYISHEHDWRNYPRRYFITVSPSLGYYYRDINDNPTRIPEDYWEAKRRSQ